MFVDIVNISVKAGDGGDGKVSFRHEKFIDRGGPDGGDGGKGGSVVLVATRNENTLAHFRYKRIVRAKDGVAGDKRKCKGATADDLVIKVPIGTSVMNKETGNTIVDLTSDDQVAIIAKGGDGGFGNAHFISSVRQAPRLSEKGERGESYDIVLEMKLVADIGLIGLPNAGKSTLLSVVSSAKPEIANYPFTTLTPNLGVVDTDNDTMLMADIPGLIEGASSGKGLGDEFLRHVSRCKVLLHLIDSTSDDVANDYIVIKNELKQHSKELAKKPQIIVLTKDELVDNDIIAMQIELLRPHIPKRSKIYAISAIKHSGLKEILHVAHGYVKRANKKIALKEQEEQDKLPQITLKEDESLWEIKKRSRGRYMVTGKKIERFASRTNYDQNDGVARLRDILKKMGILHELVKQGIEPGDKILFGSPTIGTIDY